MKFSASRRAWRTVPGRCIPPCLLLLCCALGGAPAHAEIAVIDDGGARVALAAPARRVISLAPHATELLYAAGGGAKVVGAVTYSDYPPAALKVPRIGDNKALDLEKIIALKPDLIIVWRHGNAQRQLERLRALHIPMFLSEPRQLDDIAATLVKLGQLLGTAPVADAAAAEFRAKIAALRARYAARAPVGVFFQVWDDPLMTLNGTHMISHVMALCGGRNVFANLVPQVPSLSTEAVLAADPEVMVTAGVGATRPDRPLPQLARWRKWPMLTAVARNNLFVIDGDLLNRPGPRLADGAAQLCRDIELARERRPTNSTNAH